MENQVTFGFNTVRVLLSLGNEGILLANRECSCTARCQSGLDCPWFSSAKSHPYGFFASNEARDHVKVCITIKLKYRSLKMFTPFSQGVVVQLSKMMSSS